MKILMLYAKNEYTTAVYLEDALRRTNGVQLLTVGIGNGIDLPLQQEFNLTELLSKIEPPDIIFVPQGHTPLIIHGIELSPIITIYYGIDTHMNKEQIFNEAKRYGLVFFAQKPAVEEFKKIKERVYWLPLACDPNRHFPINLDIKYDVAFVGGIDLAEAHLKRRELLKAIQKRYKLWVGRALGIFLTKIYSHSKIIFNCSVNNDLNMRIFEGMACKKLVITDKLTVDTGLNELFEDKKHLILYDNEKDMLEKIDYYLKNDKERETIANNGYQEVIQKHTYLQRAEFILSKVNEWINSTKKLLGKEIKK